MEEPDAFNEFLSKSSGGKILKKSKNRDWEGSDSESDSSDDYFAAKKPTVGIKKSKNDGDGGMPPPSLPPPPPPTAVKAASKNTKKPFAPPPPPPPSAKQKPKEDRLLNALLGVPESNNKQSSKLLEIMQSAAIKKNVPTPDKNPEKPQAPAIDDDLDMFD